MTINYDIAYEYCATICKERELYYPLNVWKLVESYGLATKGYTSETKKNKCNFNDLLSISSYGFLLRDTNSSKAIIYYNDTQPIGTIKFTLLHELGHYRMNHLEDTIENDRIVNCFARNLLAPVSICKYLNLSHPEDIKDYFDISISAAVIRKKFLYWQM